MTKPPTLTGMAAAWPTPRRRANTVEAHNCPGRPPCAICDAPPRRPWTRPEVREIDLRTDDFVNHS